MFRFAIRDMLWLTVLVGLGVGWYVDRINLGRTYAAGVAAAEMETDILHDSHADMMAAIHDAGVRVHKQANGRYSVRIVPGRSMDPILQPAGDAPFKR